MYRHNGCVCSALVYKLLHTLTTVCVHRAIKTGTYAQVYTSTFYFSLLKKMR